MSRIDDFEAGLSRRDADRLFREDAARRRPDPRLIKWVSSASLAAGDDRVGRLLTSAFATFCIVGGIAMILGMPFLPALALSMGVFLTIGLIWRMF